MKKSRLLEPSTWAGFASALGAFSAVPGPQQPWLIAVAGACGAVAVWLREGTANA